MCECIFCKIVKGKLPSYQVYEDKIFLGFLDIYPRTKGHTLLIPKMHYQWIYDVPRFADYWLAVLKITKAMQNTLKPSFVNYATYGLDVPHAHIHILPRFGDVGFMPEVKKFTPSEMQKIAQKIKQGM